MLATDQTSQATGFLFGTGYISSELQLWLQFSVSLMCACPNVNTIPLLQFASHLSLMAPAMRIRYVQRLTCAEVYI
jgi:hypothetical protein